LYGISRAKREEFFADRLMKLKGQGSDRDHRDPPLPDIQG